MTQQALAVRFDPKSGEMAVYGGALVSAFLLSLAVAWWDPAMLIGALICLGGVLYFLPKVMKRPALVITEHGLFVDGLGVLPWAVISEAEMVDKAIRSIRNAEIYLTLSGPLATVLEPLAKKTVWRQFMFRVWHEQKPGTLMFKMEPLWASPDEIFAAIKERV